MTDESIIDKIETIEISPDNEKCISPRNDEINCPLESIDEENKLMKTEDSFYTKAQEYWSTIPPTVDGMLGGFGIIHTSDIKGSQKFFADIFKSNKKLKHHQALDCGAGIGRVTKYLLMPIFDCVDMVEQDSNFTKNAVDYVGGTQNLKLGHIYNCGLQEFTPELNKYDVIWCQWVLAHLTNDDLINFMKRLKFGLRQNGLVILKENITSSENGEVDVIDSSVTRPLKSYKKIIKLSGYRIIKAVRQTNLPKDLYAVYMIACVPITN